MNVAFGTVIYPNAMKYAEEFINSINAQTFDQFDMLIINDEVDETTIDERLTNFKAKKKIIKYAQKYSPAELRVMLILEAKKRNYDILIIGDFDDCFSNNRVEKIIDVVNNNNSFSFFYNTITDFSGHSVMPELPKTTKSIKCILDYNYLGMSNTAIKLKDLEINFINSLFEFRNSIFDWYLFSRMLLENKSGIFVSDAITYYRFHDDNLVGEMNNNPNKIEYEIKVKRTHYQYLSSRSQLILNRYNDYVNGNISYSSNNDLCYWWGYTIGGFNNEF